MPDLTTSQAAAQLSEKGYTDRNGGPVKARTVQAWCEQGRFPHAYRVGEGYRAVWQIPIGDVEQFLPPPIGRPKKGAGAKK